MALSQAYVNEVLNHLPSTCVVDEVVWPQLVADLHYEDRDLTTLIVGQMKLRSAKGGYDGLVASVSALLTENETLRAQVTALTERVEALTPGTPSVNTPELVHG